MMDRFEMAQALKDKANVSYEEAKQALEQADWNMLEAVLVLEKAGRLQGEKPEAEPQKAEKKPLNIQPVNDALKGMGEAVNKVVKAGNRRVIQIIRKGEVLYQIPLTIFVLLLIVAHWLVLAAAIVGWIAGCHYRLAYADEQVPAEQATAEPKA